MIECDANLDVAVFLRAFVVIVCRCAYKIKGAPKYERLSFGLYCSSQHTTQDTTVTFNDVLFGATQDHISLDCPQPQLLHMWRRRIGFTQTRCVLS